jgi:hypothetical protein
MREIAVGSARYRLVAEHRGTQWIAHAERTDARDRFGIECAGRTEEDALAKLSQWLTWQDEHASALDALQRAENAYHRAIAGSAFASPTEGPSALEVQKDALDAVEAARVRLDEIRARKPEG